METDSQYRRWPSSVTDLLRPTFPGMLRNVRKNLFNLVLIVDPITPAGRSIIKLAESFVIHLAPVHLGIVFDTRKGVDEHNEIYRSMNAAFNYLAQTKTPRDALGFLTDVSLDFERSFFIFDNQNSSIFSRFSLKPMLMQTSR